MSLAVHNNSCKEVRIYRNALLSLKYATQIKKAILVPCVCSKFGIWFILTDGIEITKGKAFFFPTDQ